jgi:hypothetical protein
MTVEENISLTVVKLVSRLFKQILLEVVSDKYPRVLGLFEVGYLNKFC